MTKSQHTICLFTGMLAKYEVNNSQRKVTNLERPIVRKCNSVEANEKILIYTKEVVDPMPIKHVLLLIHCFVYMPANDSIQKQ